MKVKFMTRWFPVWVFCLLVFLISGCRNDAVIENGVEVTVDGDGQFPAFLVGTWKADQGDWEIVFAPNGKITSAVISLGRVKLTPGRVTTVPMELGGKGTFTPGPWSVQYLQMQRQLIVEIAVEKFRVELGKNIIKGRTRDFFIGEVSKDGRYWWAQRFSYPEYTVDTAKFPNYKLPVDPNENPKESLLFEKVPQTK
jgi:hypothetical protein